MVKFSCFFSHVYICREHRFTRRSLSRQFGEAGQGNIENGLNGSQSTPPFEDVFPIENGDFPMSC